MSQLGLQSEARSLSKKEIRDFYTIEIYFELKTQLYNTTVQQISLNRRRNEDKGKTKTYQSRPENKSQKERKIKLIKKKFTKII